MNANQIGNIVLKPLEENFSQRNQARDKKHDHGHAQSFAEQLLCLADGQRTNRATNW